MNYIGIDIGATNLKAGLVDDRGRILATQKMKIVQIESPDALARNLARMTQELAEEVGVPMEEIFSIGVGVPGVVEIRSGSLQYSCNLPFRRVPLRRLFHKYLNKYQVPWDLDKKVDFLLYYHDISKAEWSRYYGGFSFIADFHGKNRCYIYEKICAPILSLNKSIDYYSVNLHDYIDSSYKNKAAIGTIVKEIESLFIETTFSEINDNCVTKPIAISFTRNKTVHTIKKELNGEYYKLMYGKRVYNQSHPNS